MQTIVPIEIELKYAVDWAKLDRVFQLPQLPAVDDLRAARVAQLFRARASDAIPVAKTIRFESADMYEAAERSPPAFFADADFSTTRNAFDRANDKCD